MTYEEWESGVPGVIKSDTLWRVEAYRLALFLADLGWIDTENLMARRGTDHHAHQLRRSTSKISSALSEGYSRNSGKARSTYYEYAAGSARESRDWYYKLRRAMKARVVEHRLDLCTQISKLALKMVGHERRENRRIRE